MSGKILCKLTDEHGRTRGDTQWGPGVTHTNPGTGDLCSVGWIHYYEHPLLAVLLSPAHTNFKNPQLWQVEVSGRIKEDCGLKCGATSVTTIHRLPLPIVSDEQRIRFAILGALNVYEDQRFVAWAQDWLSGKDRSEESAISVRDKILRSWEAVWPVLTRDGKMAGIATLAAIQSEVRAATAVEVTAKVAARSGKPLDLIALAEQACQYYYSSPKSSAKPSGKDNL